MPILERTYTIPLRSGFRKSPKYYRTNRAISTLRAFVVRHMKVSEENVRIGQILNDELWRNGIKNPPARITVTLHKGEDGIVLAELAGKTYQGTVKPEARREEPQGLKERLQAAVGKKEAPVATPQEQDATPQEKAVPASKKTPAKKAAKKTAKPE